MTLRECYRLLELPSGASLEEVKAAYRRLARRYHPDANPGGETRDRFMAIADAYQYLTQRLQVQAAAIAARQRQDGERRARSVATAYPTARTTPWGTRSPQVLVNPRLSAFEQELKEDAYRRLQELLHKRRWPRAIALAEGLVHRIPQDPEIQQWLAIVYHRWGRELIDRREFDKARIFLKKALQADPYNRDLWLAAEREFERIEQVV
ncbi:MAG: DnaJ domain-containing protein [Cyanobacteria bacterium]|nr:DnaJ domain-containing protein [Cyanobacteriota bacterium]